MREKSLKSSNYRDMEVGVHLPPWLEKSGPLPIGAQCTGTRQRGGMLPTKKILVTKRVNWVLNNFGVLKYVRHQHVM